jgi:AcrR family transcriptional regulator
MQRTKDKELSTVNSMEDFSRYDQKLEFILRNAARIFAEKSYHSTSMRDISRATGVSLAGLYHYCKSKEELLFLIQDNCFGRVIERLEVRLSGVVDPVEKLRIFIDNHLAFFAANMAEMKVLSHEAESLAGDLRLRVSHRKESYTHVAREILGEVQQSHPAVNQPIDLTVATYALFGMMNWIYNWYNPDGKLAVNELVENVTRLYLTGFVKETQDAVFDWSATTRAEGLSVWREPDN